MLLKNQRRRRRNHRGRHAGAAQLHVIRGVSGVVGDFVGVHRNPDQRILVHQVARLRPVGGDQVTGGNQIRLGHHVIKRRALRAVGGDHIVNLARGAHVLHCTDRDHVRVVARGGDGAVAVSGRRVGATVVSRRHHHHDARIPGRFHRLAERVLLVAARHRTAEREIDDLDVVGILQRNRLLNRLNHQAVRTGAVVIQNFQVDQLHTIRNSLDGAVVIAAR